MTDVKNPVSLVYELQDAGVVAGLAWMSDPVQRPDLSWKGNLSFHHVYGSTALPVSITGQGGSKALAKRSAAALALRAIADGKQSPPLSAASDSDSDTTCPDGPSESDAISSGSSSESDAISSGSSSENDAISSGSSSNTDYSFDDVVLQCATDATRASPTKRQTAQMLEDSAHASKLAKMASLHRVAAPGCLIMVLDVEKDERPKTIAILEVSITTLDVAGGTATQHIIISENADLQNVHCPSAKDKFAYGTSACMLTHEMVVHVQGELDKLQSAQCGFLVGHSVQHDIKWLEKVGVKFAGFTVCDIGRAERARSQRTEGTWEAWAAERGAWVAMRGLREMMRTYEIKSRGPMHNAGNDSEHTALVLKKMLSIG